MKWEKLGRIFMPQGGGWMSTHAQNPLPEVLGHGYYRVHFSARDERNRSRGGHFVFHIDRPNEIFDVSEFPSIDLGALGAFDDAGAMPGSLVALGEERLMFYTGWSRTVDVPFAFHIGLASSKNDKEFSRVSRAPVLGRNFHDPYVTGAPYVLVESGRFRMWYVSCTSWVLDDVAGKPRHYYTVKYAESKNGLNWQCSDHLCLGYAQGEYAIARPVVWKSETGYRMWFSYRGDGGTYRVGVADSADGIQWTRSEQPLGIDVSRTGWDSEMI